MSDSVALANDHQADWLTSRPAAWTRVYQRRIACADFATAAVSAAAAVLLRFGVHPSLKYVLVSSLLPVAWVMLLLVLDGYDMRFIGTGSDEFRKVLNAGWSLSAGVALLSYGLNSELSRVYLVIAMPMTVLLDLIVRYALRKHLHRLRSVGKCMSTVVAVGHPAAVADLVKELRRYHYHGLEVVAACLAGDTQLSEVAGVPVVGDLDDTAEVVRRSGASTVAVKTIPFEAPDAE